MDIKKDLLEIVNDYVEMPAQEIDTSVGLKFIGLNSFVILSMVSAIEEHFNISIPDDKLSGFNTLDDIVRFIEAEI